MFKKFSLGLLALVGALSIAKAQDKKDFVKYINSQHDWVDAVFNTLTPKEKVAQLFLVRAHTNLGQKYIDSVAQVVQDEQLGGLVVFQGGPVRHVDMFNRYQSVSKVPLLVTFDGEWGLGMRMPDSTLSFPYQMTLGAVQDNQLIYRMGREVALDFHRIGMHFNFAPDVDINNNPKNPVIGIRSFGDNKYNVTQKAKAYMDGMVDGGILASIKHFPGHGDTDVDSHHDLPKLPFDKTRLDTLELYPFKELIKAGAPAVMVAHMNIPVLDDTPNMPSSISKKVVTDLLRNELGFKGLTVTDAMDMKGVKKFFPNGEADVQAIVAGHDLLEVSENSKRAIDLILKAIESGRISQADIDARVKRVLAAKLWLGLDKYRATPQQNLYADLHRASAVQLIDQLSDAAITALNSTEKLKSFKKDLPTAIINVGVAANQTFQNELAAGLTNETQYFVPDSLSKDDMKRLVKEIKKNKQFIIAVHDTRLRPRPTMQLNENVQKLMKKFAKKSILTLFTNVYALDGVEASKKAKTILLAYQNDAFMQKAAAKTLLGQNVPKGKLPVTINKKFKYGQGK
ncbi:MAG: glycoside hydrolase family 3 [Sphingobacterium sp.]|jgi:beta-glucosidase-like glycosyl hydrolase|uniref:glycoside hydrolase family 3 protein n=1 Tax=Sphingobacterium sp. CZ-UAM TaxID=1933868 RepID=UPI0009849ABB|nr:glycoside hydrolase family 3 N-terminal domain-containing protein [Sphingobacterium sp. CZ-UAM]MDF2516252.1 glycoside hydrolase family 3 [Sphingobacterium sp.]OOG17508.1 glycoside hydrolase family 3 [Sphingobacterium sp. CZ-UAM]